METKNISLEIKDKVAYIGFGYNNEKSMTTLDEPTLKEAKELVENVKGKVKSKEVVGVIFFSHIDSCFIAGADINLISTLKTESDGAFGAEQGQLIYNDIEDLSVPTVACVHGPCLGGGMELALACKTIICSGDKKTILGLPEVKLGLIPGFGGTYRMPKRVGLPNALDLILAGKTINAKKAKRIGLVDGVYPKERLISMGEKWLKKNKKKASLKESVTDLATDNFITRKIIFQKARESVLKLTKGFYQAPLKILDTMESGASKGRASYLASEAQAFGELCVSEQSKNLQHIFFLMEGAKKYNGPKSEKQVSAPARGAVLGAGTMGGGIAWLMSNSNMYPLLKDINNDALELGLKQSSAIYRNGVKKRKLTFEDFERKQRSINPTTSYAGFKNVDLVIEAIVENLDIKKKVFADLENHVSDDCIIASNTSSLKVTDMAEAFERPERFAGLHFFNPVNKMPLVEIVAHDKVAPETLEALYKFVLASKKTPVLCKDGPGFIVNRILIPYLNEASYLLMEGVPPQDVEEACLNFGMPMGPGRLLDEVGLDVAAKVGKILYDSLGERVRPIDLSDKITELGFLGKKNGKGFFLYDEKGKETGPNPEVMNLLPKKKIHMDEVEIQKRVFLPMINEASMILDEGLVSSAAEVDLALIFGIGFPPFRGGLLRYADSEGLERIAKTIQEYADNVDAKRYALSDYLKNLVEQKKKFYEA